MPLAVAYDAEYKGRRVSDIDLDGKTVSSLEKMTVKELKMVLKDLKLLQPEQKNAKKKVDLQQALLN